MKLLVEFFYDIDGKLHRTVFDWYEGMTVEDVLKAANFKLTPEQTVGIFSKAVNPDTQVMPGDRLEIYRPLLIDPKEARRNRASLNKKKK